MNKLNIIIFAVVLLFVASTVEAKRGGGGGGGHKARSASQSNVNRGGGGNKNTNINRNNNNNNNININNNVNINVKNNNNHHHGGCCYYKPYHPIATAAAITATAIIVGSIVNSIPATGCQTVIVNGFGYRQCGSTWYQPQMSGSSTTYIVINDPHY